LVLEHRVATYAASCAIWHGQVEALMTFRQRVMARIKAFNQPLPRGLVAALSLVLTMTFMGLGTAFSYAQSETGVQRLGPGDKIQVTVFGQSEFSGEFSIEGSGALVLPVVGGVMVRDLTLAEAEKLVSTKLESVLQRPIVSLRLTDSRPIYILGDVRNPGNYPFRSGASVLSVVATAGGFGPKETVAPASRADFLQAEERLRMLQTNQRTLLIRLARLEAQRSGASELKLPDDPRFSLSDPNVARIVAQEREIMLERKKGQEQTLNLLLSQKPRIDAEIKATRAQAEAEERQLKLLQEHIADYAKLLESGLARRYTTIELQREEGRHKGNLARYVADIARLDLAQGEVDLRIKSTENAYLEKLSNEIQEVRSRLQEIDIAMPLAREVREAKLQQGGAAAALVAGEVERIITVIRMRNGKAESFKATPTTLLAPGDIVDVQRAVPTDQPSLGYLDPITQSAQAMP
jgi:polysaccharide export outer membrane protein